MSRVNLGTTIANIGTGFSNQRKIVKASNGTLLLFAYSGSGPDIQYKKSTDDGVTWDSSWTEVEGYYTDSDGGFDVIIDDSDNIYITWIYGPSVAIYLRKLTYSGGSWSIGTLRSVGTANFGCNIVKRTSGQLFITATYVHSGVSDLYAFYSDDDGVTWSNSYLQISSGYANAHTCSGIIIGSAIWGITIYGTSNLIYNIWDDGTHTWGASQTISSSVTYYYGDIGVAKVSDSEIYVAAMTSGGIKVFKYTSSWDSGTLLSNNSNDKQPSVSIVVNKPIITWQDYDGTNYNIVYRKWNGSSWNSQVDITNNSDVNKFPSTSLSDNYNLYLCYRVGEDSPRLIYFDKINLNPAISQTILSDSKIKAEGIQKTITSDTTITVHSQQTINSDSIIKIVGIQENLLSDAIIKILGIQKTITSNAKIFIKQTKNILSNAKIFGPVQKNLLSDTNIVIPAEYATRIKIVEDIAYISCDTNPAKLIIADVSTGLPQWNTYELDAMGETYQNPQNLTVNTIYDRLYLACASGQVANIDLTNISNRTLIDLSSSYNLITIDDYENFDKLYIGTDKSTFDLYYLDNAIIESVNTDFRFLRRTIKRIKTSLNFIFNKYANTDFRFLLQNRQKVNTDFRYNTVPYTSVTNISMSDVILYINGTQVYDFEQSSLKIMLNVDTKSSVDFVLIRKHDKIDYTLAGVYNQITNNNTVQVYIKGKLIFDGKVTKINCSGNNEQVSVTAEGNEYEHNTNTVDLGLPGLNEQLHSYHVLLDDISIDNPVIDLSETNPAIFLGVRVDLGHRELESQYMEDSKYVSYDIDTFKPEQNYTYFWYVTGQNFITGWSFDNKYIGTSLAPVSSDTYLIESISFKKQRIFPNRFNNYGIYTLGSAPFKEISTKNGEYIAWWRWEDRADGLYSVRNSYYYYVNWAKKVAAVEYRKIQNINGTVLPKTSASLSLTIDAFMYYNLRLLQRINIVNTTQSGIYKNSNGFPLSIKGITIDFGSMRVDINTDNNWSQGELDAMDATLPPEPQEVPEFSYKIDDKFDLPSEDTIE